MLIVLNRGVLLDFYVSLESLELIQASAANTTCYFSTVTCKPFSSAPKLKRFARIFDPNRPF